MTFANAFGQKFAENTKLIRTRSFDLNGHTFKVKVPLTSEMEAMHKRIGEPDEVIANKYYEQMTKTFIENRDDADAIKGIEILEDDVLVDGKSVKEVARQKTIAEKRIVEMFKLLIPEQQDFDMESITYEMIEELFPFSIQVEMMEAIAKTIAPDYKDQRKKS